MGVAGSWGVTGVLGVTEVGDVMGVGYVTDETVVGRGRNDLNGHKPPESIHGDLYIHIKCFCTVNRNSTYMYMCCTC